AESGRRATSATFFDGRHTRRSIRLASGRYVHPRRSVEGPGNSRWTTTPGRALTAVTLIIRLFDLQQTRRLPRGPCLAQAPLRPRATGAPAGAEGAVGLSPAWRACAAHERSGCPGQGQTVAAWDLDFNGWAVHRLRLHRSRSN